MKREIDECVDMFKLEEHVEGNQASQQASGDKAEFV